MSDITTSNAVKTFMQSADQTAMVTALGIQPFDASSPGALGNTTPSTVASTTLSANDQNAVTNGRIILTGATDSPTTVGALFFGVVPGVNNWSVKGNGGAGQTQIGAESILYIVINGTFIAQVFNTTFQMRSGATFLLDSAAPGSASASGASGTITWDSGFVYVCVSDNTWKRAALTTW